MAREKRSAPLTDEQRKRIEAELHLVFMRIECDLLAIARKYLRRFTLFRDDHGFFKDEEILFECIEKFYQETTAWFVTTEQYKKEHTNIAAFLKQRMVWRTLDYRDHLLQEYGLDSTMQLGDASTQQHVTAPTLDKARDDLRQRARTNPHAIPDVREELRPAHRAFIHRQLDEVFHVKGITAREKQLLTLRFADELSPQQIADIMGLKNANVASKEISKTLKKVRKKSGIKLKEDH